MPDTAASLPVDARSAALRGFLARHCPDLDSCTPLPVEASSRRLYRLTTRSGGRLVAMDAPPASEANARFVALARHFAAAGVRVPEVLAADLDGGYLLVTDLGSTRLADLPEGALEAPYRAAIDALQRVRRVGDAGGQAGPYSAARLRMETALFRDWLLERWLGQRPGPGAQRCLARTSAHLVAAISTLPIATLHRDWHCRNLLAGPTAAAPPGVVDFQDALVGPVTYDVVSLLRDCYRRVPAALQATLGARAHQQLRDEGLWAASADAFQHALDLTGLQRHLKALGIFARLALRDGRPSHLRDMPLTLEHALDASARHPELAELHRRLAGDWQPAVLGQLEGAA